MKAICDPSGSNTSPWKQWQFFTTPSGIRIHGGDVSLSDNLNVYPNPTRGVFSLTYTTDKDEGISAEVIDAFGKRILMIIDLNFLGNIISKLIYQIIQKEYM